MKSSSGRYATAFASCGDASAAKNPADSSGRGWTVTSRTATHQDVLHASCNAGTCSGAFGGTHLRIIDWSGKTLGADQVVNARIAGDIAVLPDGSLVWAYVQATPDYSGPLSGSPTSSTLTIARLG